jgi:hypothetical protein
LLPSHTRPSLCGSAHSAMTPPHNWLSRNAVGWLYRGEHANGQGHGPKEEQCT